MLAPLTEKQLRDAAAAEVAVHGLLGDRMVDDELLRPVDGDRFQSPFDGTQGLCLDGQQFLDGLRGFLRYIHALLTIGSACDETLRPVLVDQRHHLLYLPHPDIGEIRRAGPVML